MSLFSWPKTTFPLQLLLRLCSSFIQDFSRSFKIFQDYSRSFKKSFTHKYTKTLVKNNFFKSEHFHLLNIQVTWTHFKTSFAHTGSMTFALLHIGQTILQKLVWLFFCYGKFTPVFSSDDNTWDFYTVFPSDARSGSIFATGEAQRVPTGSILLYHTMVRGTLGMFTKQSFLTHCGCQCWWPTSCFLSHSFSCRPPAQSYHGRRSRGCCSLP